MQKKTVQFSYLKHYIAHDVNAKNSLQKPLLNKNQTLLESWRASKMDIKHVFAALEISRVSKMLKKATQISKVKNQHTPFYF